MVNKKSASALFLFCSLVMLKTFILLCVAFSLPLSASSAPSLESISNSKDWLNLLGYKGRQTSSVTSSEFFFAEDGSSNALSELKETIKAFSSSSVIDSNDHPICKFPGRFYYLVREGVLAPQEHSISRCTDFLAFSSISENIQTYSPSLVFATGYLGNPASYYGHLLINLDGSSKEIRTSNIQNMALSYGARIPEDENMVLYVIKGLIGIYDSTYTPKEFYYHLHNYTDGELRDLWEYRFRLTALDYKLLSGHLWEMIGATHKYYFTNRNCAYRVAELLELVTDEDLSSSFMPWVAPQSVLQALQQATRDGDDLISTITYFPSRQSKLYTKFNQLSANEKNILKNIVKNGTSILASNSITSAEKIRVIDTLIDYYRVINKNTDISKHERYNSAIKYRYSLPVGTPNFEVNSDRSPHLGHKPSYLQIGYKTGNITNRYGVVRLRPAYYDQLDSGFGHIKGSSLSMLDTTFSVSNGKINIEHIDILKIENLYSFSTKLPGDDKQAWSLQLGATKINNDCTDCLGYFASAGKGYAASAFDGRVLFNAMGHIGSIGEKPSTDNLFLEPKIGANIYASNKLGLLFELSNRKFFNLGKSQYIYQFIARYKLSEDFDVRASFISDKSETWEFNVGYYF